MEYISSAEQMESLAIALRGHDIIGIDTESNNLHAYQDRICLIQLWRPVRLREVVVPVVLSML